MGAYTPVQTSYSDSPAAGYAGQIADFGRDPDVLPARSVEVSAEIPFGFAVVHDPSAPVTDQDVQLPAGATNKVAGIVLLSHSHSNAPDGDLGTTGLKPGALMDVMQWGRVKVTCEDGCAVGDRLFIRFSGGTGAGTCRSTDAGGGTCIDATKIGKWVTKANAGAIATLEINTTAELD